MRKSIIRAFAIITLFAVLFAPVFAGKGPFQVSAKPSNPPVPYAENDEIPEALRAETMKVVWETVRDEYYDPAFGGKDWKAIGEKYRPLALKTSKSGEFHALLGKMLAELGRSHLAVFAPHQKSAGSKPNPEARQFPAGIVLGVAAGRIALTAVAQDSPAWSAGLRPGHIVSKAGEAPFPTAEDIRKQSMRALALARRALAGPAETSVEVTVGDDAGWEKTVSLPRSAPFREGANLGKSIFESRRVHPRIGYIRFDGWAFDLSPKLEAALKEFADTDGLIIDCRQNRGGVDPGVNTLAKALCADPGFLALETTRKGERREWKHEGSGAAAYKGAVAILIDDGSGSASEVFSGAMQEKGRAVVLGHTSYGGVLNSTQSPLPTGGILQFPHSDMITPKGKSIEGAGVVPDIQAEMTLADLAKGKDTVIERAIAEILARIAKR